MANNYTPLDMKKFGVKEQKHGSKIDAILISIIIITILVLGVLLFMMYQKSL